MVRVDVRSLPLSEFRKNVWIVIDGDHATTNGIEPGTYRVEIVVDVERIAKRLGLKAAKNKTRKASEIEGLVMVYNRST
jgi:hypothetical protein